MKRITIHDKNTLSAAIETDVQPKAIANNTCEEKAALNGSRPTPYCNTFPPIAHVFIISDATFNGRLIRPGLVNDQPVSAVTEASIEIKPTPYDTARRYMHNRLADKALALNSQIDRYAHLYSHVLGMKFDDFGNPGVISPCPITIVGRIISETEGKLIERGVLLESSRQMGSGCRVPLDFGNINCNIFPGEIVVLEGSNSDGNVFHVVAQRTSLLLPKIAADHAKVNFTMVVAAGPFTMDDEFKLDYRNFERLLNFVYEQRPGILVLIGPFIDIENLAVVKGRLEGTPEHLFHNEFMKRLNILISRSPGTKIIIIPSTKDMLSDPILPQPPYPIHLNDLPNLLITPNPAIFSINGMRIHASSSELLLSLGMAEYSKNGQGDKLLRLCNYIHQQASFYPLHPAPSGVNIDYNLLSSLEFDQFPDIFLSVSQLRCFARYVDPTLYINPGQFCRKRACGTLAYVTVVGGDKRVDFYQF